MSNFYASEIVHEGKTYPTSEHYYQCQKFTDMEYYEKVRLEKNVRKIKAIANAKDAP